jgi:hypothetical protein
MLAWHGRIPRRPISSWITELKGKAQELDAWRTDARSGMFACSIFNQAALVASLVGDPRRANRLLDAQRTFVEDHHDHFTFVERRATLNQIVVNKIRLMRAQGAPFDAVVLAETALCTFESDEWCDASVGDEGNSFENAIADLKIELCKSLLAARSPDTGRRCEAIALAPEAGEVLRGVSAEIAVTFYLERGDQLSILRMQEALSRCSKTSHIMLMRRLHHQATAGRERLAIVQMGSALATRAELVSRGGHRFIDHLFYAELVADILRTVHLYGLESRVLMAMRDSARILRDLPFFVKTTHRLSKKSNPPLTKLFPIYHHHAEAVLCKLDELENSVNCLKLDQWPTER